MPDSEKDRAANDVVGQRATLDLALSDKRNYPMQEFMVFAQAARRYIEITQDQPLIHRSVARAVNGLREYLAVERKRVPGDVLFEADRLECMLFVGYDPSFEGDEPPELGVTMSNEKSVDRTSLARCKPDGIGVR
jgi:hypothetical protein